MSKEDIMEIIEVINTQLEENKKVVDAYAGQEVPSNSDIMVICTLSQMLISNKQMWKETLLREYGVYYNG